MQVMEKTTQWYPSEIWTLPPLPVSPVLIQQNCALGSSCMQLMSLLFRMGLLWICLKNLLPRGKLRAQGIQGVDRIIKHLSRLGLPVGQLRKHIESSFILLCRVWLLRLEVKSYCVYKCSNPPCTVCMSICTNLCIQEILSRRRNKTFLSAPD